MRGNAYMASFVKPRVSPESVAIAMLLDCRYTTQIEGLFGGVVGRDEGRLASGSVELSKVKAPNVEGAARITSFVALLSPHELRV
jgi:hypothetical protein